MSPKFRKSALVVMTIFAGVGLAVAHAETGSPPNNSSESTPPIMRHMGPGMMNGMEMHMGAMGMGHDSATMAQLGTIHELFLNHDRIKRTVTNLPNGIRTTTESDDPRIAQLIKEHVANMGQRVDAGNDPGLPIESGALHAIFKNYDKIQTKVETIEEGVVVIQTSADKEAVAALQQHALEVSDFVTEGMLAMRTAMMKRMGAMMPFGMHGGMHDDQRAPQQ